MNYAALKRIDQGVAADLAGDGLESTDGADL